MCKGADVKVPHEVFTVLLSSRGCRAKRMKWCELPAVSVKRETPDRPSIEWLKGLGIGARTVGAIAVQDEKHNPFPYH